MYKSFSPISMLRAAALFMPFATAATSVKILATIHTGITVPSLSSALTLFNETLGLPIADQTEFGLPLTAVTGCDNCTIKTAHLELPGSGGHMLELLEYELQEDEQAAQAQQWKDYHPTGQSAGSFHLCFEVENLNSTLDAIGKLGYEKIAEEQKISGGADDGTTVVYARGQEGILELWERP